MAYLHLWNMEVAGNWGFGPTLSLSARQAFEFRRSVRQSSTEYYAGCPKSTDQEFLFAMGYNDWYRWRFLRNIKQERLAIFPANGAQSVRDVLRFGVINVDAREEP